MSAFVAKDAFTWEFSAVFAWTFTAAYCSAICTAQAITRDYSAVGAAYAYISGAGTFRAACTFFVMFAATVAAMADAVEKFAVNDTKAHFTAAITSAAYIIADQIIKCAGLSVNERQYLNYITIVRSKYCPERDKRSVP